jgi:hypothetical protein
VTGIALLSQRTLVPQQPIEWDIAAALSLKVETKMHNVTSAYHLFFTFGALLRPEFTIIFPRILFLFAFKRINCAVNR